MSTPNPSRFDWLTPRQPSIRFLLTLITVCLVLLLIFRGLDEAGYEFHRSGLLESSMVGGGSFRGYSDASVAVYDTRTVGRDRISPHFRASEFASKDGARELRIHPALVVALEQGRAHFGALSLNSAYRSPAHNQRIGGVKNSAHVRGMAADIEAPPGVTPDSLRWFFQDSLGLNVGLYTWGVHIDVAQPRKDGTPRFWDRSDLIHSHTEEGICLHD